MPEPARPSQTTGTVDRASPAARSRRVRLRTTLAVIMRAVALAALGVALSGLIVPSPPPASAQSPSPPVTPTPMTDLPWYTLPPTPTPFGYVPSPTPALPNGGAIAPGGVP